MTLDQLKLPGTPPFLDPLLAQDRVGYGLVKFGKDQPIDAVVPHEAGYLIQPMFPDATSKISGYADIKRTIASAREDVHARRFLRHPMKRWPWVPAFAETTNTIFSCNVCAMA